MVGIRDASSSRLDDQPDVQVLKSGVILVLSTPSKHQIKRHDGHLHADWW